MAKKKKLNKFAFFSKFAETTASALPWPAACAQNSRTLSFRAAASSGFILSDRKTAAHHSAEISRTLSLRATTAAVTTTANSAYIVNDHKNAAPHTAEISRTQSFCTTTNHKTTVRPSAKIVGCATESEIVDETEAVIEGLRSERLFFEPGETNSILEEVKLCYPPWMSNADVLPLQLHNKSAKIIQEPRSKRLFFEPGETNSILEEVKQSRDFPYRGTAAALALESRDPFLDFRLSMEEMVEAHGMEDFKCLQELLSCYLRVNRNDNHGYIVGAFVDLLIHRALASAIDDEQCCCSSSGTTQYGSFTSPLSFSSSTYSSTSQCLSLLDQNEDGDIVVDRNGEKYVSSSSV